jgi:hypothetical protein
VQSSAFARIAVDAVLPYARFHALTAIRVGTYLRAALALRLYREITMTEPGSIPQVSVSRRRIYRWLAAVPPTATFRRRNRSTHQRGDDASISLVTDDAGTHFANVAATGEHQRLTTVHLLLQTPRPIEDNGDGRRRALSPDRHNDQEALPVFRRREALHSGVHKQFNWSSCDDGGPKCDWYGH